MPRLMSVAFTEDAVVRRQKTVTYFVEAQGIGPYDIVTRIEWAYLDDLGGDV